MCNKTLQITAPILALLLITLFSACGENEKPLIEEPSAEPMFLSDEMPLSWRYALFGYFHDSDQRFLIDTVDVVFIEKLDIPLSDIQYSEYADPNYSPSVDFAGSIRPISPAWLILNLDGRRRIWFETEHGLFDSLTDSIVGDLLVPINASGGQEWRWTPSATRRVASLKDTVIAGKNYSVIEIIMESGHGEKNVYGWEKGTGLVYYSTNWPEPNYSAMNLRKIEMELVSMLQR